MSLEDRENEARKFDREMGDFIGEISAAIEALDAHPECEEAQRRVCLATRAAYTEFYTHAVIDGHFDAGVATALTSAIQRASSVLGDGDYKDSVRQRCKELVDFVRDASKQCPADTAI